MTLHWFTEKKVQNLCNEWSLKVINYKLYIIRKFELIIGFFIPKIVNHSENCMYDIYLQTGARIKHIKKQKCGKILFSLVEFCASIR